MFKEGFRRFLDLDQNKKVDGVLLTENFLRIIKEGQSNRMMIAGDSQVYHTGGSLKRKLDAQGYEAFLNFKSGATTGGTIIKLSKGKSISLSLVIILTGGNNPSAGYTAKKLPELVKVLNEKFDNPEIIFGLTPPLTGKRVPHNERTQKRRQEIASTIANFCEANSISYFDPRSFMKDPASIKDGDGLHVQGSNADKFASGILSAASFGLASVDKRSGQEDNTRNSTRDRGSERLRLSDRQIAGLSFSDKMNYAKVRSKKCIASGYLGFESQGPGVVALKKSLSELGHNVDDTEFFDKNFLAKVLVFQKGSGLRQDGCVGPVTEEALSNKKGNKPEEIKASPDSVTKKGNSHRDKISDMIFKKYAQAGLSKNIAAAAIANGVGESNLKHYLVGDGGNSVGLFQIHRGSKNRPFWKRAGLDPSVADDTHKQFRRMCIKQGLSPGGYKCSVRASGMKEFSNERERAGDWRFNPEKNTEAIINIEVKRRAGSKLRNADKAGASIPELAAIFCRDIERPKKKEEAMRKRRIIATKMFGNRRLTDK